MNKPTDDDLIQTRPHFNHQNTQLTITGFTESAGSDELLAGDCTSCAVSEDKSAYWTPPMYFKDASTGEYTLVDQVGGMLS